MSEHDENLIHLDGLMELGERAGNAHAVDFAENDDAISYERFGICTTDLLFVAANYGRKTLTQAGEAGGGIHSALMLQFLAGFDIGYQARLELETREQFDRP